MRFELDATVTESQATHINNLSRTQVPPIRPWHLMTSPENMAYAEQAKLPDGLDGLTNFEVIQAERKATAQGSELTRRAKSMAPRLGCDVDRLTAYVVGLLGRVPKVNRWDYRDDLEQTIWRTLVMEADRVKGDWTLIKLSITGAYRRWYGKLVTYKALAVDGVGQAISLDRTAWSESQSEGYEDWSLYVKPDSQDWETDVETAVDNARYSNGVKALQDALPELIRGIIQRRLDGVTLTPRERKQFSRWLATNAATVRRVLAGSESEPILWRKASRK